MPDMESDGPGVETAVAPPKPSAGGSRRQAARRLSTRTVGNAWNDDIFSESAAAAFWQTLSVPPLLLGLFGTLGFVGRLFGPETVEAVQDWIIQTTGGSSATRRSTRSSSRRSPTS